ncbi:MAG: polysaccharide deacetylase family protein [Planctomycetota bacterium]|jgi:peptidoglycan/xylan/chitin deacetylase (PgdA/CDA1 family)
MSPPRYFLLRYDTENPRGDEMLGFLPKVLEVHARESIPVTLFCTGQTLEARREEFIDFWDEASANPLFDVQDHSYSHIGVGYEEGRPVPELRDDYEKSLAAHRTVFGKEASATALCGVSDSGSRLPGLDSTEKSREELAMLAGLGLTMLPAYVTYSEPTAFCSYARLGYPHIMGYPSVEGDTHWLMNHDADYARTHMKNVIDQRWESGGHGAVIFHDWCQWNHGPDQELSLVCDIADYARNRGFTLATIQDCYNDTEIWREE